MGRRSEILEALVALPVPEQAALLPRLLLVLSTQGELPGPAQRHLLTFLKALGLTPGAPQVEVEAKLSRWVEANPLGPEVEALFERIAASAPETRRAALTFIGAEPPAAHPARPNPGRTLLAVRADRYPKEPPR